MDTLSSDLIEIAKILPHGGQVRIHEKTQLSKQLISQILSLSQAEYVKTETRLAVLNAAKEVIEEEVVNVSKKQSVLNGLTSITLSL